VLLLVAAPCGGLRATLPKAGQRIRPLQMGTKNEGLLGSVWAAAEGIQKELKVAEEEDRIAALIVDAEETLATAVSRRALPQADESTGPPVRPAEARYLWRVRNLPSETREKIERARARRLQNKLQRELSKAAAEAMSAAAQSLADKTVDATLTAAAAVAEAVAGEQAAKLPSAGMDATMVTGGDNWANKVAGWARGRRDKVRGESASKWQRKRLEAHQEDLALLGLSIDELTGSNQLTDKELRQRFRAQALKLHPDRKIPATADAWDGSGPSIYDVNRAYEAIRRLL